MTIVAALAMATAVAADGYNGDKTYRYGDFELGFALRLAPKKGAETWVNPGKMKTAEVSVDGARTVLVWKGHPVCGEHFTVTVELTETADGTEYAFRYADNEAKGLDVIEVIFPDVLVPRTDATAVLCPKSHGQIRRPDWKTLKENGCVSAGRPYAFHFIATLGGDRPGYYLDQRGDARLMTTALRAYKGGKPGTVRLQGTYEPAVTPASNRAASLPFTGILRRFRGDWFAATSVYRAWTSRQPWVRRAAARDFGALRNVSLWMWNRGKAEHVIAPAERFQKETGLPVALDWYWWHETPYDKGYPYFWPPREGEETFRAAVERLRKGGIFAQVYTNGLTCDCDDDRWEDGMKADAKVRRDGSLPAVMYNVFDKCRLTEMCGEAPHYHKHMRGLLSTLFGCGLPSVYMDQIGCGGYGSCWNPAHKHAPGGGDLVVKGFRKLFADIKADNPGKFLSTEDPNEAYLDSTESVICLWQNGERFGMKASPEVEMIPVFSALYHGDVACFGSYAVIGGRPPWDPRWSDAERWQDEEAWKKMNPPDQFALEFARGPVIGYQPCVHNFTLEQFDDPANRADVDFVKATAKFWHDNLDFMFDGEMRAPGRLKCRTVAMDMVFRGIYTKDGQARKLCQPAVPVVLHNVWMAKDGRIAAALVNWTREPQYWRLDQEDIDAEGVLPPRSWALVTAEDHPARADRNAPIEVSVKQTAGGPHLCVDGRLVRPRAFYGAGPSVGFISEFKEYEFTLPFTARHTTDKGNLRIAFNSNLTTYWLRDVRLEEDKGGKRLAYDGTFATEAAFRANWAVFGEGKGCTIGHEGDAVKVTRIAKDSFYLYTTGPLALEAGKKYRFKFAIRANQGRQFFSPACWQVNPKDGQWERCPLSYGDTFFDTVRLAGEVGVDIVTGHCPYPNLPAGPERDKVWTAGDAFVRKLVSANPDMLYIPRVSGDAPDWYAKDHPEIYNVYDNGFVANTVALSDPGARKVVCGYLEDLTRHLRRAFPRNFAGLHFCGQNSGEWFYQNAFDEPLGGYEKSTRDAFRRWLKAHGAADWETAEVPSAEARRDTKEGLFLHPVKDRRLLDFAVFRQEDVADHLSELGAAINRGSDGKVLKLSFYGYAWEVATARNGPSCMGHYAVERMLKEGRANIDALSAPFSYSNRKWPGSTPVMCAAETLARNGVFWFNEDDTRTYLEDIWDYKTVAGGKPVDKPETVDLLTKNAALEIVRGFGDWWMDLFGRGWYRDADLWSIRTRLSALDDAFLVRRKPYEPEIAVIMDEASMLYLKPTSNRAMGTLAARKFFDSCGATYGQYYLNDILDNPPENVKMFFMAYAYRLTDAQRAKIAALRKARPDATFVWCWAPGYVTETDFSLDAMRDLTGFTFSKIAVKSSWGRSTELGLERGLGYKDWGGGLGREIDPLFTVAAEPGDEVWSVYNEKPEAPALVCRKRKDGTGHDIFLGPAQLFQQLVRCCAEKAGVHCYTKAGEANVAAAEGYVFVQAIVDGPIEVDFGTKGEVVDFLSGEKLGAGPKLSVPFRKGEARVFKVHPGSLSNR